MLDLDALGVRVESGVEVTSGASVLRLKEKLKGIQRFLSHAPWAALENALIYFKVAILAK